MRPTTLGPVISRRTAAQRLDISEQMAARHGLPRQISEDELAEIEANPPAWLAQSRANRTGKKAVWVELECAVCGFTEKARPKKWWPTFTYLACEHHEPSELPSPLDGEVRAEYPGIGSRFVGVVDVPVD